MAPAVSRRAFGQTLASVIPGLALVKSGFAQTLDHVVSLASQAADDDEMFWGDLRTQMLTPDGLAYMNTARLAPTPRPIYENLVEYWRLMAVSPTENSRVYEQGRRRSG